MLTRNRQDIEARLADLERADHQPVDLEAATTEALGYPAKFPAMSCRKERRWIRERSP